MLTLVKVSICFFAGCAALGMIPPAVLVAKARKPVMAVIPLLIADYVVYVLITAAEQLPHGLR